MPAVSSPAVLACGGPRLYLPLLVFSGAFPSMLLYGVMPPLVTLGLRRQSRRGGRRGSVQLLPGSRAFLGLFAGTALGQ
eukprot:11168060-Lingulodinium_polyedra.AAC.1